MLIIPHIKADLDEDELDHLIEYQRDMIHGAVESGELDEAKQRRRRLEQLKALRGGRS